MKYSLINIIACPMCKNFPLKLIVFSEKTYQRTPMVEKPFCDLFCGLKGHYVKDVKETPCDECLKVEVVEGILVCEKCLRWYPIIDEIPRMLPDDLRKAADEVSFLKKFSDKIPKEVLEEGKPYNLKS
ncbi:MAG: Trm112 family protein [Sulfolobales archaeon]